MFSWHLNIILFVCDLSYLFQVDLDDGTVRTTLATSTNMSRAAELPSAALTHCPGFAAASEGLRRAVDR